jgi:hypothetical protein
MLEPLAIFGNNDQIPSYTNLSRSFALSILDENEKNLLFNYHMINLSQNNLNLTYSIHFEMKLLNLNLSYL